MSKFTGTGKLMLAGFLAIFLAACGEKQEAISLKEDETKEEAKKEPVEEKQDKDAAEIEEDVQVDEQETQSDWNQLGTYPEDIPIALQPLQEGMQAFATGNFELADNPSLMQNSDWINRQSAALQQIQDGIDLVRNVEVPENETVQKAHQLMLKAMDEYEMVVVLYPDAIEFMDLDKLNQCTEYLNNGNDYLMQSNKTMQLFFDTL